MGTHEGLHLGTEQVEMRLNGRRHEQRSDRTIFGGLSLRVFLSGTLHYQTLTHLAKCGRATWNSRLIHKISTLFARKFEKEVG